MQMSISFFEKVDMEKVNLDVVKPWIQKRITELLGGIEDEVLIAYIFELLESSRVSITLFTFMFLYLQAQKIIFCSWGIY